MALLGIPTRHESAIWIPGSASRPRNDGRSALRHVVAFGRCVDYADGMMSKSAIAFVVGTTAFLGAGSFAYSTEKLPGVSGDHRIVKPLPEPIDGVPQNNDAIKVGGWEVRISGSVRVDIGAGNLPPPRR